MGEGLCEGPENGRYANRETTLMFPIVPLSADIVKHPIAKRSETFVEVSLRLEKLAAVPKKLTAIVSQPTTRVITKSGRVFV